MYALVAVAAGGSSAPKAGQEAEPRILEGPGPYSWDCNAESAYFHAAYAPAVSNHFKVTGIMHVLTMHVNRFDQWGAAATVQFDANRMLGEGVSFQLLVNQNHQDTIAFVLRGDNGLYQDSTTSIASQPNKESTIPFMVTLDQGIVTATAASSGLVSSGGVPQRMSATSKHRRSDLTRFGMSCSGAHILFSNVAVSTGS
jgi:hypothetical protein